MCKDPFCANNWENRPQAEQTTATNSTRLQEVNHHSHEYKRIVKRLTEGWKHPNRPLPRMYVLYKVIWPEVQLQPFLNYRTRVATRTNAALTKKFERTADACNEQWLYHGTARACSLGDEREISTICQIPTCSLCKVLRYSFNVSLCGTNNAFMRFGKGIYLTACSSKADQYCRNIGGSKGRRALVLSRVVMGIPYPTKVSLSTLQAPPPGYDSVHGTPGEHLKYEEEVVYYNDAIRPAYVLVYNHTIPKPADAGQASQPAAVSVAALTQMFAQHSLNSQLAGTTPARGILQNPQVAAPKINRNLNKSAPAQQQSPRGKRAQKPPDTRPRNSDNVKKKHSAHHRDGNQQREEQPLPPQPPSPPSFVSHRPLPPLPPKDPASSSRGNTASRVDLDFQLPPLDVIYAVLEAAVRDGGDRHVVYDDDDDDYRMDITSP